VRTEQRVFGTYPFYVAWAGSGSCQPATLATCASRVVLQLSSMHLSMPVLPRHHARAMNDNRSHRKTLLRNLPLIHTRLGVKRPLARSAQGSDGQGDQGSLHFSLPLAVALAGEFLYGSCGHRFLDSMVTALLALEQSLHLSSIHTSRVCVSSCSLCFVMVSFPFQQLWYTCHSIH
jgi:hypothetical protein